MGYLGTSFYFPQLPIASFLQLRDHQLSTLYQMLGMQRIDMPAGLLLNRLDEAFQFFDRYVCVVFDHQLDRLADTACDFRRLARIGFPPALISRLWVCWYTFLVHLPLFLAAGD